MRLKLQRFFSSLLICLRLHISKRIGYLLLQKGRLCHVPITRRRSQQIEKEGKNRICPYIRIYADLYVAKLSCLLSITRRRSQHIEKRDTQPNMPIQPNIMWIYLLQKGRLCRLSITRRRLAEKVGSSANGWECKNYSRAFHLPRFSQCSFYIVGT